MVGEELFRFPVWPGRGLAPRFLIMASTKLALASLSLSLAKSLADTGITVNSVSPGFIVTPVLKEFFLSKIENAGKTWEEIEPAIAKSQNVLGGRLGRVVDIASTIASEGSEHITAFNVRVDGGMLGVFA